jgi:4-hydroxybenzoate polyprenyltransferase
MFLNDAFDVEFDREYRKERPIPSLAISLATVWRVGFALVGLGSVLLIWLGRSTGILTVLLVLCIVIYNAIHKRVSWAPVLMGLCRFFLYLIAASTAQSGITGSATWCGIALALYVIGLSFLARGESRPGPLRYGTTIPLAAPIVLALILNADGYRPSALLLSGVLGLWTLVALRRTWFSPEPNVGQTVSWLLAGIVFVDWLAVVDAPRSFGLAFIGLFLGALLLQRPVPAT